MGTEKNKENLLQIFRLLNPASRSTSSSDFGGITSQDVAMLLASIKINGPQHWARYKFALHDDSRLDSEISLVASCLSKLTNYKTPKEFIGREPIRRLCNLAIEEHAHPNSCPTCNGRMFFEYGNLRVKCGVCGGTGMSSQRTGIDSNGVQFNLRAHKFGVSQIEFEKRWERIFDQALLILDLWEDILVGKVEDFLDKRSN